MVVLSAAICTKNGKALLARQFSEMTKSRVEGLLSAFPKLIGTGNQHTFIETENIRYVYQPLDSLFLVLITNKNSNILEDLETLQLLAKLVPEYSSFDESEIQKNAFELIFTFDEVIAMGYKERATVHQIKHNISMESHEEDIAKMEQQIREREAKIEANKRAKEIAKLREEQIGKHGSSGRSMGGIGGGIGSHNYESSHSSGSGYNNHSSHSSNNNSPTIPRSSGATNSGTTSKPPPGKEGMKLGTKTSKKSAIAQVLKEEKIVEKVEDVEQALEQDIQNDDEEPHEPVHVTILESFSASVTNDGRVDSIDIKGVLSVDVSDKVGGKVAVQISSLKNNFTYKTHPTIDKAAFSKSIIRLKDDVEEFPSGGIFRWQLKPTTSDEWVPIKVNCWPSPSKTGITVTMEYDCTSEITYKNVIISIPNPTPSVSPVINKFDGLYEYDQKQKIILWKIPIIDESNRQGSMEFSIPKSTNTDFFPVKVDFKSNQTLCDFSISSVLLDDTQQPTKYSSSTTLSTDDSYQITK